MRPSITRVLGVALCVFMLALVIAPRPASSDVGGMIGLVNGLRAELGLSPLCDSPILGASAQAKAEDMAFGSDSYGPYFGHYGPDGRGPEDFKVAAGYPPNSPGWGENILWGAGSAEEAFGWWRNSADHYANMTSTTYTEIGVGNTSSDTYSNVWVLQFGNASTCGGSAPPPAPTDEPAPSGGGFAVGTSVVVTSNQLNLRSGAGFGASAIGQLPMGAGGTITGDAVSVDGYTWQPVSTSLGDGWVAIEYLTEGSGSSPAPTEEPPAPTEEPTGGSGDGFAVGSSVVVADGPLNLRAWASVSAEIVASLASGTTGTITGEAESADGYTWQPISTGQGDGWVAVTFLAAAG